MIFRRASRLLVLDPDNRLLLFRFVLPGRTFWATPGGGLEAGESFEDGAVRELFEEVGLSIDHPGDHIMRRKAQFADMDGALIEADECFFLIRAGAQAVSADSRTAIERNVIVEHRWWTRTELEECAEQVWPDNLAEILVGARAWRTD
jgi:8-oxo-dGTP diphosphatase